MEQPELDLKHIHWSSPEWIYSLPSHTLSNADEALDYFALSPFWDIRSNNQNLRVQRTVTNRNYGSREERLELPLFKAGFEYIISHSQPPDMFVIQRRDIRPSDGSRDNVTGVWFILEGKIYPTPTLYEVMANRLKNATHMINNTFSQLSSAHPPSNPRVHSTWRSQPPNAQASSSKVQGASDSTAMDIDTPANGGISVPDTQGASEPIATTSTAEQNEKKESGPNFRLLNALQSTKALYAESQSTAQAQSAEDDPREELRRIEAQIYGQGSGRDKPEMAPRLGAKRSVSTMSGQAPKKDVNGVPSPMNKFPSIGPAGSGGARTPSMMSFVAAPSPLISQQ